MRSNAPGRVTRLSGGLRARILGEGDPLVFLHGLGASLRYWGRGYDELASDHRLVFLDLLGFGGSAKPGGAYDAAQHTAALQSAFEELDIHAGTIVAHSAGAIVAMHYAAARPAFHVAAFGAPIFRSAVNARRHLRSLGVLARLMADDSPWAERLCAFMCAHRELARRAAPLLAPRLPAPVAADGVEHSWQSYKGTFDLIARDGAPELLTSLSQRLTLYYGRDDGVYPASEVRAVLSSVGGIPLLPLPVGDHHLPIQFPARCRQLIRAQTCARA